MTRLALIDPGPGAGKPTAAEHLAALTAVWWEFDVLTAEVRCDCRTDLKPGDPIVSKVERARGPKTLGGVAIGLVMCVPCGARALQRHTALVSDLEQRARREAEEAAEAAVRAAASPIAKAVERLRVATEEACSKMIQATTSTVTLDGEPLPTQPALTPGFIRAERARLHDRLAFALSPRGNAELASRTRAELSALEARVREAQPQSDAEHIDAALASGGPVLFKGAQSGDGDDEGDELPTPTIEAWLAELRGLVVHDNRWWHAYHRGILWRIRDVAWHMEPHHRPVGTVTFGCGDGRLEEQRLPYPQRLADLGWQVAR